MRFYSFIGFSEQFKTMRFSGVGLGMDERLQCLLRDFLPYCRCVACSVSEQTLCVVLHVCYFFKTRGIQLCSSSSLLKQERKVDKGRGQTTAVLQVTVNGNSCYALNPSVLTEPIRTFVNI